ncbi:MAG: tetratricopeptide repeat family protein [uncultured bacterium]|nr:MAG: tetratricopeptide repeat family protein [uncultured bacterium]
MKKATLGFSDSHLPIQLNLANIYKIQGLYDKAAELLQKIIQLNPDYVPALNNLGTVLYARGKFEDAVNLYHRALQKKPDYIDAYYNLGLALIKQNKLDEACSAYQTLLTYSSSHFAARFHLASILIQQEKIDEALKHLLLIEKEHPFHFETQSNLGTCYLKKGLLGEAKSHYLKALELTAEDMQILFNLGVINSQQGHMDNAIQYYQRALRVNPDFFPAHNNLGIAFIIKQHAGFALHHFQEALRLEPHNEAIQYTVKMLAQSERLLAAPPAYITSLFDAYADHYEPHLLVALDYILPNQLKEIVLAEINNQEISWDILDLGCGTGLCGVPFKAYAKSLTGVDLSEKMLDVAREKNIYDALIQQNVLMFLTDQKEKYDLILAGDVLVYLGDLQELFQKSYYTLRLGGLFAFNTEISEGMDYRMNQSGRFSHQNLYLEELSEKNHFSVVSYKRLITRMQNNEPVHGHLYVLKKI